MFPGIIRASRRALAGRVSPIGLGLVGALVLALVAAPAASGVMMATTITFPTVDLTAISDNVGGFFAFLAPVLWLVGGIAIGGLLLHKARGLF